MGRLGSLVLAGGIFLTLAGAGNYALNRISQSTEPAWTYLSTGTYARLKGLKVDQYCLPERNEETGEAYDSCTSPRVSRDGTTLCRLWDRNCNSSEDFAATDFPGLEFLVGLMSIVGGVAVLKSGREED